MDTFFNEKYVLTQVLKQGRPAMNLATEVEIDSFICTTEGMFGLDHGVIWHKLLEIYNKGDNPHYANAILGLSEYASYMAYLVADTTIPPFDPATFTNYVNKVQEAGLVYKLSSRGEQLHLYATDLETLNKTLNGITDFPAWVVDRLEDVREPIKQRAAGVQHISQIVPAVKQEVTDSATGTAANLLLFGMPQMRLNLLFPMGKITCLQGLSGSGKSSLLFQVVLGTAMSLAANNHPGKILIQSLEMTSHEVAKSLASKLARVDTSKLLDNSISQQEADQLNLYLDLVAKLPIYINDTPVTTTTASLQASGLHDPLDPVVLLVSDYNELFKDENANNEQRVATIFRNQFYISRQLGCAVIVVSQSTDDSNDNTYLVGPDATRYSRAILQASDVLVTVHNYQGLLSSGRRNARQPENLDEDKVYLFINKYRGAKTGGRVELDWLPQYTAFADPTIGAMFAPKLVQDARAALGFAVQPVATQKSTGTW